MHYRIRGNNVQLVKTVRDEASGKAVSKPVTSINLNRGISDEAKESITAEELAGVELWLEKKQDINRRKRQLDAETFPELVGSIVEWVRESSTADVTALSDEILFGLKDLQMAINLKLKSAS